MSEPAADTHAPFIVLDENFERVVLIVAHPDDVEWGLAAAVARWTSMGKQVSYLLATRGEAGIEGVAPEIAGPLREEEQRAAGVHVGVSDIVYLDLPDGGLQDAPDLVERIAAAVAERAPEVAIVQFSGAEWGPGASNHPDHIAAGLASIAALQGSGIRLYEQDPHGQVLIDVQDHLAAAVDSLAAHHEYLAVLDPDTPVRDQARKVVEQTCSPLEALGGRRGVRLRALTAEALPATA
ncbi:PIG-L deacetylase family protein [Nakamurella sp. A5-74]|uniref:PIG-L deacetylase family protein n=1 Tax=Nakamurella sp. A5-74 TaxID=3158264 RepID=A0AAU8DLH5_9ACTN